MTPRRIAILVDNVESDYQVEILSGALRATRATNVNAVIVAGGRVELQAGPDARNFIYDIVAESDVSGLLVLSGSLGNHCGIEALGTWLGRFDQMPVVCVGPPAGDFPTLSVDNAAGTHEAVTHLITGHRHRKIGFLKGPAESREAQQRYEAYARAMDEHGLDVDPRLVTQGETMQRRDGHAAVRELFDTRSVQVADVDALIGVNDDVALGAMESLAQRGIIAPDAIAVVGFDNSRNSTTANPPLTTVDQLVDRQGYEVACMLLEGIEQDSPPSSRQLSAQPRIRASCGCAVPNQNDSSSIDAPTRPVRSVAGALMGMRARLTAEMARAAAGRMRNPSGWEERLLSALSDSLSGESSSFCRRLVKIARREVSLGGTIEPCNDVTTALRLQVLSVATGDPEVRARVEDMFQEARLRLTNVGLAAYRERDHAKASHVRSISRACLDTIATHSLDGLSAALTEALPPLGIETATISRLRSSSQRGRDWEVVARLAPEMAVERGVGLPLSSLGVDQSLEHRAGVVVMPLGWGGKALGVAGFSWGAYDPRTYELLRESLSIALYSTT